MPANLRQVLASVVLITSLGGVAGMRPCLDDDGCTKSCSPDMTILCPLSDQHRDPPAPFHSCDCMCHVPGIAVKAPVDAPRDPPVELRDASLCDRVTPGLPDAPFHPPRS